MSLEFNAFYWKKCPGNDQDTNDHTRSWICFDMILKIDPNHGASMSRLINTLKERSAPPARVGNSCGKPKGEPYI